VNTYYDTWSFLWKEKNTKFEKFLVEDPNLCWLSGKMFYVWDNSHYLQAWWPYIDLNHPNAPKWHLKINSFVMDTTNNLVELLIARTDINK
jgi:hypothetical protein